MQYLQAAVDVLKSSSFGAVQVGACRAIVSLVPRAPAPALQPLLDPIYEGTAPSSPCVHCCNHDCFHVYTHFRGLALLLMLFVGVGRSFRHLSTVHCLLLLWK